MEFNRKFEDVTTEFDSQDANENKLMAVLSYLSWLVIIPLVASKSPFARFHANQGLVLAICEVVWGVLLKIVSRVLFIIFGIFHLGILASLIVTVLRLVDLAFFIFSIIGIVDAVSGRARKFPIIGSFSIIK